MTLPSQLKPVSPLVRQAGPLIAEGRIDETLELIRQSLQLRPGSGQAWHDAGTLLFAMNRPQEALQHFERAIQRNDCPRRTLLDMAHTCMALDRPQSAVQLLDSLASDNLLDETLIEQVVRAFAAKGDMAASMDAVKRGQARLPDSQLLPKLAEQIRRHRAKIAFFCGGDGTTFLRDILDYTRSRYQVRIFEGTNTREMHELMQWSDISWFEWCTNLAQLGSSLPKVCRTIIRLHRYEAYMQIPQQICWDNVDLLMTVGNSFVIKALEKWVPGIQQKVQIATIPNGVNLDKIPFAPRRPGKKLAFVASLRMVKNPMLLMQCMARLHQIDPEYQLYIAGDKAELLMEHYVDYQIEQFGLKDVVIFDGWQKDIPGWLADKNYLLVTSVIESQGMGCLEAMASGIRPIIHNFPGSHEIYNPSYIFNTPDEFCSRILSQDYDSADYREFVERRYPLGRQLAQVNEVLTLLESNPFHPQQPTAVSEN